MIKYLYMTAVFVAAPAMASSALTKNDLSQEQKYDEQVYQLAAIPNTALALPAQQFGIFKPKSATKLSVIDYEVWDLALENIVLGLGPSIRKRQGRPDTEVGTRILKGHRSGYRLEGSRVTFSYLNDDYRSSLTAYRKDLETIANKVDISTLRRNEQLAFWLNLHNVTLIEQIALNYPVRQPEKLRVGTEKELLNDAKLLNIRGVAISLCDIRENIVYPNWQNPNVLYGFFRGNIGSPALPRYAYTGSNVNTVLNLQGGEFVNSLRGFHESRNALKVSTLYDEARSYFFQNWSPDLKTHLRTHANPEVLLELSSDKPIKLDRYDAVVADLLAGDTPSTANLNVTTNGRTKSVRLSPEVARLLRELDAKTVIMRNRGMLIRRGTVTIEDVETIDVDIPQNTTPTEELPQ